MTFMVIKNLNWYEQFWLICIGFSIFSFHFTFTPIKNSYSAWNGPFWLVGGERKQSWYGQRVLGLDLKITSQLDLGFVKDPKFWARPETRIQPSSKSFPPFTMDEPKWAWIEFVLQLLYQNPSLWTFVNVAELICQELFELPIQIYSKSFNPFLGYIPHWHYSSFSNAKWLTGTCLKLLLCLIVLYFCAISHIGWKKKFRHYICMNFS